MTKYVALLRGIGPQNPNMRNEKLRNVFEQLGFRNVRTIISSGNILFESPNTDVLALEATIEAAWPDRLGFRSTTIIRSLEQLQELVNHQPFAGSDHAPTTNLTVTFLKKEPIVKPDLAKLSSGHGYRLISMHDRAICSVVDLTAAKTPDLMARLEKELGKEITTRTWKTVERIVKGLQG